MFRGKEIYKIIKKSIRQNKTHQTVIEDLAQKHKTVKIKIDARPEFRFRI